MEHLDPQWGILSSHHLLFLPFETQWGFAASWSNSELQRQRNAGALRRGCSGGDGTENVLAVEMS